MTSKLKTDVLETVSGSGTIALTNQLTGMTTASLPALTAAQMPSGSVLQVLYVESNVQTVASGSNTISRDILTKSFTRKAANSFFILKTNVYMAPFSNADNQDNTNPSVRFEINNTKILQTADNTRSYGGFYGTDVPMMKTNIAYNGLYEIHLKSGFAKSTLTGSVGDTVEISVVVQNDTGGIYINRSQASATSRAVSMLEIIEVQS